MDTFRIDDKQELTLINGRWVLHKNGVAQNTIPNSLYKYYPLTEYSLDALEKAYFYLNNPKDFNDPFDCNYNLITENQRDLQDWEYVPLLNDVVNKGISCFSEDGINPLMWAHYANSYNGFVIKIKPRLKISSSPHFISAKLLNVIYSNNPNSVPQSAPFANQYQLIIKLNDWQYENEWRLIVDKNRPDFSEFHYDPDIIEEISFGYKINHNDKEENIILRNRLDKIVQEKFSHLPLFIVGPDQKKFELKKMPFKYGEVSDIFPDN
jgi:hypothetical protein